jgi:hypothetical protein
MDLNKVRPRILDEKRLSRAFQALLFGNRFIVHVIETMHPDGAGSPNCRLTARATISRSDYCS